MGDEVVGSCEVIYFYYVVERIKFVFFCFVWVFLVVLFLIIIVDGWVQEGGSCVQ